jgi:hypothetical protein
MKKYSNKNRKYIVIAKLLMIYMFFFIENLHAQEDLLEESSLYEKVMAITNAVDDPNRQVGEFDPYNSPSLPIGIVKEINGTKYIIAIDSAFFIRDKAFFSAYMAIQLPNADKKIAFAAKNIQFNPKGVIGGNLARLMLVSDHLIDLGPNTKLHLKADGSNFVNWSCNGFESVNIRGHFLLSDRIVEPANESDTCVSAMVDFNVQDVQNILVGVAMTPFKIKGIENYEFTISQAYADLSDHKNPPGVAMPLCYQEIYASDISLWRGFYLQNLTVKLPRSMGNGDERTTIYANNIFIDDAGVTGAFGATNLLSLSDGKTQGNWGLSIKNLTIGLTTNELTKGALAGELEVPFMDNNAMEYSATISKNPRSEKLDYQFTVQPDEEVNISSFNSTISLNPTSVVTMSIENEQFKPKLILNGDWTLDNKNAKLKGIAFQNLTILPSAPYVSGGTFSLVGDAGTAKAVNFPISVSAIGIGVTGSKPTFRVDVGLNFGSDENDSPNNFSATTSARIKCLVQEDEFTGKQEWEFDSFGLTTIALAANTAAFRLNGMINFIEDDPVFGDGFKGGVEISVGNVIQDISLKCMFGKLPTYRYWLVEGSVPVNISLGSITLNKLIGGLSYHVENTETVDDIMAAANAPLPPLNELISPYYIPNEEVGIGFKAGVGFFRRPEKSLNGEVIFGIQFNAAGGLRDILLTGEAYTMVTKAERASSSRYGRGTVAILYDNQEKILDAQFDLVLSFDDAVTANIWAKLYLSRDLWYFWLGTPDERCRANIVNFATASAYLMFGQNLPPMPPPPPQVAGVLGEISSGRNADEIAAGNGLATGMSLDVGFNSSIGWGDYSLYAIGSAGIGFDMTLYKYDSGAHCAGEEGSFGANYWYLNGQVYAYGSISAGITGVCLGKSFDVTLISASMAMLLQGKLPKPTYVYGGLYLQAKLFNVINLEHTMEFSAGTNCDIVY